MRPGSQHDPDARHQPETGAARLGDALILRPAIAADVAAIAAIYAYYVRETVITFEVDPPGEAEMAERISSISARFPYIVAEDGGRLLGYAYATELYSRAAYRWAVETTIYLAPGERGSGLGTRLYQALLDNLRERGFVSALGKVTLPNDPSDRLHRKLGFTLAGRLNAVGHKHGGWYDVGIYQTELAERPALPAEPVRPDQL